MSDRWLASLLFQSGKDDTRLIFDTAVSISAARASFHMYANTQQVNCGPADRRAAPGGSFDAGREHQVPLGVERNRLEDDYRARYAYLGPANLYAGNFADAGVGNADNLTPYADATTTTSSKAAYAQTVLSVGRAHPAPARCVRYDRVDSGRNDRFRNARSEQVDHAWTHRLGLSHDFTDHLTGYAVWAQSFTPVSGTLRSGGLLEPETGTGYEAGLKTEWLDGRLDATLSAYQQDLTHRPLTDPNNGPGENFSISAGLHRTRGVEAEVNGSPLPGLTLGVAATWMTNEFLDRRDPNYGLSNDDSVGRHFGAYASYELQSGVMKGLSFGATLVSYGDRAYRLAEASGRSTRTATKGSISASRTTASRQWSCPCTCATRSMTLSSALKTLFNNFYGAPRAVLARVKYRLWPMGSGRPQLGAPDG